MLRDKIAKEGLRAPFASTSFPNLQESPLGVLPKKEAVKLLYIYCLSYQNGSSVNDGILPEDASVSYVSFDCAICLVMESGPFRQNMILSQLSDSLQFNMIFPPSLGCYEDGNYYFYTCLPMDCSILCTYCELFSLFLERVVLLETGSGSTPRLVASGSGFEKRPCLLLQ